MSFGKLSLVSLLSATLVSAADTRIADAARSADKAAVRALLARHADVNAPQADGSTALHWAAQHDDPELADILIRAGANVQAANRYGVTALLSHLKTAAPG